MSGRYSAVTSPRTASTSPTAPCLPSSCRTRSKPDEPSHNRGVNLACNTLPYKIAALRDAHLYGYIGRLFSEVLGDVRVMPEVVGFTRPALKWEIATRAMNIWVKTLRDAAWLHAYQLTSLSTARRAEREREMLNAITDALNETSAWMPWDALKLTSPDFLYDEPPGQRPLYFMGMPLIPIDVMTELQLSAELIELIISIFILFFVIRNWMRSKQNTLILQKAESARDKADKAAARYIDQLGSNINHRLNELFNQG